MHDFNNLHGLSVTEGRVSKGREVLCRWDRCITIDAATAQHPTQLINIGTFKRTNLLPPDPCLTASAWAGFLLISDSIPPPRRSSSAIVTS